MDKKYKNLICILLSIILLSCSKQEPQTITHDNCFITIMMEGVAVANGNIYVTKDYTLRFLNVNLVHNGTGERIYTVTYYLDNINHSKTTYPPFSIIIPTHKLDEGVHKVSLEFEVKDDFKQYMLFDKFDYTITVVPTKQHIPNNYEVGTYTHKFKLTPDE